MSIPVEKETEDMDKNTGYYERCIFCAAETDRWHTPTNRPVCPWCALVKDVTDIATARYNY